MKTYVTQYDTRSFFYVTDAKLIAYLLYSSAWRQTLFITLLASATFRATGSHVEERLAHSHQVNRENPIDPMDSSRSESFNKTMLALFILPTCTGSLTKTEGGLLVGFLPQC